MFGPARTFLALGAALFCTLAPAATASAAPAKSTQASVGFIAGAPVMPSAILRPGVAGYFQLHNVNASGKCIGISGGIAGDWTCTTNPDQTWHWGPGNGIGWNQLINGNGQCLAVSGGSEAQGARILGYTCLGTADQYWWENTNDLHLYNYKAYADFPSSGGWVVGVNAASTAYGAPLILWPWNTSSDQEWF